jgi:hypothetical protein
VLPWPPAGNICCRIVTFETDVLHVLCFVLFCGEGPRSRCYGRTAALRLIVQPCDEDEEKDVQFFHFSK